MSQDHHNTNSSPCAVTSIAKQQRPAVHMAANDLRVFTLDEALMASLPFEELWALCPAVRGMLFNANEQGSVPANRFYRCYGKTPERADGVKTYMFSATGESPTTEDDIIPEIFWRALNHLNRVNAREKSPAYNQVLVNWYKTGSDYTPFHIDCLTGMPAGATVSIVSVIDPRPPSDAALKNPRHLVFKPAMGRNRGPGDHLRIPSTHGLCVTFGGEALSKWRHGIPKAAGAVVRRISISFRAYV